MHLANNYQNLPINVEDLQMKWMLVQNKSKSERNFFFHNVFFFRKSVLKTYPVSVVLGHKLVSAEKSFFTIFIHLYRSIYYHSWLNDIYFIIICQYSYNCRGRVHQCFFHNRFLENKAQFKRISILFWTRIHFVRSRTIFTAAFYQFLAKCSCTRRVFKIHFHQNEAMRGNVLVYIFHLLFSCTIAIFTLASYIATCSVKQFYKMWWKYNCSNCIMCHKRNKSLYNMY